MKTKTHVFTLKVKTNDTRRYAECAVLRAFAMRNPDYCDFHLISRAAPKAKVK